MDDACLNLSTDLAVSQVQTFLRAMGQPVDQEALQSVLLTIEDVQKRNPTENHNPLEAVSSST